MPRTPHPRPCVNEHGIPDDVSGRPAARQARRSSCKRNARRISKRAARESFVEANEPDEAGAERYPAAEGRRNEADPLRCEADQDRDRSEGGAGDPRRRNMGGSGIRKGGGGSRRQRGRHPDSMECGERPKQPGPEATFEKYRAVFRVIDGLRVKEKRELFKLMRVAPDVSEHTLFPRYGFTAGEFSAFHILTENGRKSRGCSSSSHHDRGCVDASGANAPPDAGDLVLSGDRSVPIENGCESRPAASRAGSLTYIDTANAPAFGGPDAEEGGMADAFCGDWNEGEWPERG